MQVYYQGMNFIPLHAWDTELRKENVFLTFTFVIITAQMGTS